MPVFSKTLGNVERLDTESFKALVNHVRVMQEELEYRLANLDSENINEINMDDTNVFSSKGGLMQLLNETEESVAKLSVKNDEVVATVEDLSKNAEHSLKLDADGVTIVDGDGNAVTISGGQIDAENLNLSGNLTFNAVDAKATNAENAANGAAYAASALANGSYPGTFINGRTIYTPNFYSDSINLFDGSGNLIGKMTMRPVDTDAFDLTSYASIRMTAASGYNAYLGISGGPEVVLRGGGDGLGARCTIAGGALCLDWNSFGYDLPANAVDGQVYFLLS